MEHVCSVIPTLKGTTWSVRDICSQTLTRDGLIELWEAAYNDRNKLDRARKLCQPCVSAVLDISNEQERP